MIKKTILAIGAAVMLTGCMGHDAMVKEVMRANLQATENRWGREFIFLGLNVTLIYPIAMLCDYLVINSIEFWTGENPINGRSPVVDIPMDKVNAMGFKKVNKAQIEKVSSTEAKLYLNFENGDHATFDVTRNDMLVAVSYAGVTYYETTIK